MYVYACLASRHASPPPEHVTFIPPNIVRRCVGVLVEAFVHAAEVLVLEHRRVAGEALAQRRRSVDLRLHVHHALVDQHVGD